MECTFMTVKELAEYLKAHPNKEVGFTSDTREDIEIFHNEPSCWHGAVIIDVFDCESLLCGYYGDGSSYSCNAYRLSYIIDGLLEYLRDDVLVPRPTKDTEICISKEDLE